MGSRTQEWLEFCNDVCNYTYKIRYEDVYSRQTITIVGILKNFTGSRITMYVEDEGLYIIPYSSIEYMYPVDDSNEHRMKL